MTCELTNLNLDDLFILYCEENDKAIELSCKLTRIKNLVNPIKELEIDINKELKYNPIFEYGKMYGKWLLTQAIKDIVYDRQPPV